MAFTCDDDTRQMGREIVGLNGMELTAAANNDNSGCHCDCGVDGRKGGNVEEEGEEGKIDFRSDEEWNE